MTFSRFAAAVVVAGAVGQVASAQFFEGFEHGDWLDNYTYLSISTTPNVIDGTSARTGDFGVTYVAGGWWQNSHPEATISDGSEYEYWFRATTGNHRAYIGFTSDTSGTHAYTVVAAPNTSNLIIQDNSGLGISHIATSVPITWSTTDFYRVFVTYEDGEITAEAFDASGTSLAPRISVNTGYAGGGRLLMRGFGNAQVDDISIDGDGGGGCYADCDGSGELDFFDFLCFQNQFAAGSPEADCDASGGLDFFDFLCFQNAFAAGCP